MLEHKLLVEVDVEPAVACGHQPATGDNVPKVRECFARYPSGPECFASGVAVLNCYVQLFRGHRTPHKDVLVAVYHAKGTPTTNCTPPRSRVSAIAGRARVLRP
jgi:hypothetical protein